MERIIWVKKKTFNKTIACLTIMYEVYFDIGARTASYFCDRLEISRYLFYDYIAEINAFFSEFKVIEGYPIPITLKYDKRLRRYAFLPEDGEKN